MTRTSRWVAVIVAVGLAGLSVPAAALAGTGPPLVRLAPVGTAFTTSTPTLTGTAGTGPVDEPLVYLGLYAGTTATGRVVRLASGTRAPDGSFAITVTPGLPDGFYTAVAGQGSAGGNGFSAPLVIEVKVHPPALTFEQPGDDTAINWGETVFSGGVGTAVGDIPTVRLLLYSGPRAAGQPYATRVIQTTGSSWSYTWPRDLPLGPYTAVVQQADNAGHIVTLAHPFRVTVLPPVIGPALNLDRRGRVSIEITCPAEAGQCAGDVLALTGAPMQPVRGGPVGLVRLLFAHVEIGAGRTTLVSRGLSAAVAAAVRRTAPLRVTVGAILQPTRGRRIRVFEDRPLNPG